MLTDLGSNIIGLKKSGALAHADVTIFVIGLVLSLFSGRTLCTFPSNANLKIT